MTMKVLVTGANGFIGTHLVKALSEKFDIHVLTYTRNDNPKTLFAKLEDSDFIFHLAGVNRPDCHDEYVVSNVQLTSEITHFLIRNKIKSALYFSSSIHSNSLSDYGKSKLAAENLLKDLSLKNGNKIFINRLPGVFGPGVKPFYNSVVATFCKQVASGEKLQISDPLKVIQLLFIDDLIESLMHTITNQELIPYHPVNFISIKDLASLITSFGGGAQMEIMTNEYFLRCLRKTYESYL